MHSPFSAPAPARLSSPSGLTFEVNGNGSVHRIDFGAVLVNLFPGSELEGGPANLYLRRRGASPAVTALLGPESPATFVIDANGLDATGEWQGLRFSLVLRLAAAAPAWFWQTTVENTSDTEQVVDLVYAQDLGLAPFGAVRLNEYYVSHYIDHTPLDDPRLGWVLAARQNLAAAGRHPWALIGSLRRTVAFATDALQLYGPGARDPGVAPGLRMDLPGLRRQHEHSMVALQDAPQRLAPGARVTAGFFAWLRADHPAATTPDDLADVDRILALPEATAPAARVVGACPPCRTLFAPARVLAARDLSADEIAQQFGADPRHVERDGMHLLSFFHGAGRHAVLRAKERRVQRPHGHILRTGATLAPDETALTSTVWMQGVFHSMLTQGHVGFNRLLTTTRGYLGFFRAHGQRVFLERDGTWLLLDTPSAFDMGTADCAWIYRDDKSCIAVQVEAIEGRHELALRIDVLAGPPARFLLCFHVALDGDDGRTSGPVRFDLQGREIFLSPHPGSDLARRFPQGGFRIVARDDTTFEQAGGDALLFADGGSRALPYLTIVTTPATSIGISVRGELITEVPHPPLPAAPAQAMQMPALPRLTAPASARVAQLGEILPWFAHDALIHFLAPRGLEQYSGGGWGTRDVCQGPVELLLALDRPAPVRALLLRVFAAQETSGDWPQWFTFFERERHVRAGDSHGDIVFWPVLAVAQYLLATQDAAVLDERVPFFNAPATAGDASVAAGNAPATAGNAPATADEALAAAPGTPASVWDHVERALRVIAMRRIPGTELAAFGHGDWNDALQPADPVLRERLSSAWTVTLHHQVLTTLAAAMRTIGRATDAERFESGAQAVARDFQQRLVADDVVPGYALFEDSGRVQYLLHPRDSATGVRYSLLPMIHAILNDLFTPEQARSHLALIERFLTGPDGARLFDRPLRYHGGLQKIFQRAETSAFFGREIGIMYMHAHLRYAEALAHAGDAEAFFVALCRSHPIGLHALVPSADLRQANCYFSSSDAAFFDRYDAYDGYARVADGSVPLDGGWRIYSSGPGIALSLVVRRLLGVRRAGDALVFDPVMPRSLDGLRATVPVAGREIEIVYRVRSACGPTALRLDGAPLAFTRGENRYRTGGALVSLAEFTHAARECCRLEIDVG